MSAVGSTTQHPLDGDNNNTTANNESQMVENDEENNYANEEEEDLLDQTTNTGDNNQFGSHYGHLGEGRPSFTGSTGTSGLVAGNASSVGDNTQVGGEGSISNSNAAAGGEFNNNTVAAAGGDEDYFYDEAQHDQQQHLPCNVLPPAPLPRHPIDGAYEQFPVGFLKYSDEKEIRIVPVGAPDPFMPSRLASQRHSLSETPVVTGSMDTVLDALLPPRRTTVTYFNEEENCQDTVDVVQRVVHSQIKRDELRQLRVELDARLKESNARREGICNVRRGIHALMFDELIRQVTIDCPERGILLRRIRDEIQMTLDAHHTLYEESVAYSTNRCVAAAKYTPAMTAVIDSLTKDISELRKELRKLEAKESAMIRCVDEQKNSDHKKYEEERLFLERTKQRLQDQYDAVKEAQEAQRRAAVEEAGLG